jgi:hypothetical protein
MSDELPPGVKSVMFLRDGWPSAVVSKVVMDDDCVGIGVYRAKGTMSPDTFDQLALLDAMQNIGLRPPDYTEIQEYVARMKAAAEARGQK